MLCSAVIPTGSPLNSIMKFNSPVRSLEAIQALCSSSVCAPLCRNRALLLALQPRVIAASSITNGLRVTTFPVSFMSDSEFVCDSASAVIQSSVKLLETRTTLDFVRDDQEADGHLVSRQPA